MTPRAAHLKGVDGVVFVAELAGEAHVDATSNPLLQP